MIECMRLIIDELGRERGGGLNDLGGREGTAMLGTKMKAGASLLTTSTLEKGRDPPSSLRLKPPPKKLESFWRIAAVWSSRTRRRRTRTSGTCEYSKYTAPFLNFCVNIYIRHI